MEGKKPTLKLCNVIGPGTVVIGKQREKKKKRKSAVNQVTVHLDTD